MSQPDETDREEGTPEHAVSDAAVEAEESPPGDDLSGGNGTAPAGPGEATPGDESRSCGRCGSTVTADARCCRICGNALDDPAERPAEVDFCRECGAAVDPDADACPDCESALDRPTHVDCWNCHTDLVATAVACHACGVDVGPEGRAPPTCSSCGTTASKGATFCPQCGALL